MENGFFSRPRPAPLAPAEEAAALKAARALLAARLPSSRRGFLRQLTLGGVALLSGCSLRGDDGGDSVEQALMAISRFNDAAQGWLFDPAALAPTYPGSMITRPFPFNGFYPEALAPVVDEADYQLEVRGRVADHRPWRLAQLWALPQQEQITRHICVEGWSAIGRWGGVPFAEFLRRVGADLGARYVGFECADGYYTAIDMPTALHPQTLMALSYDGQVLPRSYGFPMKLRIPTKLGYKNPKHVRALFVTDRRPGGYWEDQGYNWFGGL
ncbi:molybdopterin-dependent oxidoreductase [Azoarcus sp. TTM-91]|uniref:molybdopterin-dependent oxidoreductase n=1 Tax=Azoarcus sp. TTM-91 TaxID=2691581 RepID=UPI00145E1564|nr:molybdopterin-dependent oxidoreductase [Azoarcus sp. TTM-91]NMG33440.1 molybdopterin-dependent oxidoreductase [Azoarcus sp. TTM-91]